MVINVNPGWPNPQLIHIYSYGGVSKIIKIVYFFLEINGTLRSFNIAIEMAHRNSEFSH